MDVKIHLLKSGFIQAPLSSDFEIRRASEQYPPPGARAVGHPRRAGKWQRIEQQQQLNPLRHLKKVIKRRSKVWDDVLEEKGYTRYTDKDGFRYLRSSVGLLSLVIQTGGKAYLQS